MHSNEFTINLTSCNIATSFIRHSLFASGYHHHHHYLLSPTKAKTLTPVKNSSLEIFEVGQQEGDVVALGARGKGRQPFGVSAFSNGGGEGDGGEGRRSPAQQGFEGDSGGCAPGKRRHASGRVHSSCVSGPRTHRHGLPPKDNKVVGALHQETREFVGEDRVHLVELLDFDANSYGIHCRLDHDVLML